MRLCNIVAKNISNECCSRNQIHLKNIFMQPWLIPKSSSQARIYHINHPAHTPLFALICKTKKINLRPPVQPDNTVAPPGSIFSGSAPGSRVFLLRKKSKDINKSYL